MSMAAGFSTCGTRAASGDAVWPGAVRGVAPLLTPQRQRDHRDQLACRFALLGPIRRSAPSCLRGRRAAARRAPAPRGRWRRGRPCCVSPRRRSLRVKWLRSCSRQTACRSPARLFFMSRISPPCGESMICLHHGDQRALDRRHHALGERAVAGKRQPRLLGRILQQHGADGAIDVRLVLEQQIERRPRHLGGAGDVVHRDARIAIGEKHLHRTVEDAQALRVGSGLQRSDHFSIRFESMY